MQNKKTYKNNLTGIPGTAIVDGEIKIHVQRKLLNQNLDDIRELSEAINELINKHNEK